MYRGLGVSNAYLLTFGDAGRTTNVYRSFDAPGLPSGYAVTLGDVDGSTASLPYFDKLPRPEQVVAAIDKGDFIARTDGTGKTITIDSGLAK